MRFILLALTVFALTSCSVWDGIFNKETAATEMAPLPSATDGPAYDPSTSPQPMTQGTVLPRPEGSTPPATYGSAPNQPQAYGTPASPEYYPPATAPLTPGQDAKGQEAPAAYGSAPATYQSAPQTYSPQTPAEVALAATLSGLWVNSTDDKEVVEFAADHYTTFYNGEMLFREPMTYHPLCPGDCNDGVAMEISCFTVSGPAGTDCYGIIRMTPEVMELSLLGVSTETIIYRKK